MRVLLITLLSCTVGFTVQFSIGADKQKSTNDGASWERAFEQMVSDARWKYTYYFWPELGVLYPDTLGLKNIVLGVDPGSHELLFPSKEGLFLSARLKSDYFNSSYYLGFLVPTDVYVTGGPPIDFIVVERPTSDSLTRFSSWLACEGERYVNGRAEDGPDLSESIDYVCRDFRLSGDQLDSSDYYRASTEAITFVSFDLPLYLITDVSTVRDLSNAFESEAFWRQVARDPELQCKLGQPMIESPRVALLSGFQFLSGPYHDSLFNEFRSIVVPPVIDRIDSNHARVTVWTWTPCAGSLIRWEVEFDSTRMVKISYKYFARDLGFHFRWA